MQGSLRLIALELVCGVVLATSAMASAHPPGPKNLEFDRSYGLAAIHADAAYRAGATGRGVIVAVIDGGVGPDQIDIGPNLSSASTDIIAGRNKPAGAASHGAVVASIIAARLDGAGSLGVAYGVTLLSIRADSSEACPVCRFNDEDLADAINYAVDHGARIINISLSGSPVPDDVLFQLALGRAVSAGVVFAMAAGNGGARQPSYPAMFAMDPRFSGAILIVGSSDKAKKPAAHSARAGPASPVFVMAPGQDIVADCRKTGCATVSATSFATPHVAGALALLLQRFPGMTGREAVSTLVQTADPIGPPEVSGAGLINLEKAFRKAESLQVGK